MEYPSECELERLGYKRGACITWTPWERKRACEVTLRRENGFARLVNAVHLSRPEHYLSIYQSGCNHVCRKCHSYEFSQRAKGRWLSTNNIAELAEEYLRFVNIIEPKERATMWHATDLCRACGLCVTGGTKGPLCPNVLPPEKILLSPQGYGPARNIIAFTGGDITCVAKFYAESARKIKERCPNMWVLVETNGYGLVPENLDILEEGGVDSFWLDIKAYDEKVYKRLCGTTNSWILDAVEEILRRNFTLEVLTLYIPRWVEDDQIEKIASLIAHVNPEVYFTILAFFPSYRLNERRPTFEEMLKAFSRAKKYLKNVKLGNIGIFARTEEDIERLLKEVGKEAI